jgi:hypothetical protein
MRAKVCKPASAVSNSGRQLIQPNLTARMLGFTAAVLVGGLAAFHQGSAACVSPPAALVAWWPAEGNANDIDGSNNGTLRDNATFATGYVGQAFSFNGYSGSMVVTDAPALRFTTAMTIEAWIYPKAYPSGTAGAEIVSKWFGGNNQNSYTTSIDSSGRAYLLVSWNGLANTPSVDYGIVYTTHAVPLNQWNHFAATYDGATLSVYLNGVLENQAGWTKGLFPGTAPLVIGANYVSSVFNGLIDEVSIYNRALLGTEVQAIYNAGSAGKCMPARPAAATATLVNGFVVGVTVTNPGWGYTNIPNVRIIGGGGSGAQAVAVVSNSQVIAVTVLNAGAGYTNTPSILIAPPPVNALLPSLNQALALSFTGLSPYDNYQVETAPAIGGGWGSTGTPFTPTSATSTLYVNEVGDVGFYRVKYVP